MTATLHTIACAANSVTRRAGLTALAKAELRMLQSIGQCTKLEALAEDSDARGNKWLGNQARAELVEEVRLAGNAMREVMLFRLQLGLEPHPIERAYEIGRNGR